MSNLEAFWCGFALCWLTFVFAKEVSRKWIQELDDVLRNCNRIAEEVKK